MCMLYFFSQCAKIRYLQKQRAQILSLKGYYHFLTFDYFVAADPQDDLESIQGSGACVSSYNMLLQTFVGLR